MSRKLVKKNHQTLYLELEKTLKNQKLGFVHEVKIGQEIFPYSLPPVIQLVLLDPVEKTVAFRSKSNPDAKFEKSGQWQLGSLGDVIDFEEAWLQQMMETRAENEEIEMVENE
ncbi:MAG: hypothetical protein KQH63_17650 [Desulfobulbaceae bacterium]|nr:hypothetical protein [Desulfobulbaceae bacterium]